MRIIIIFFILILYNYEIIDKFYMRNFVKDLDNSIKNACNRKAFAITNNSDMYNCLNINKTANCSNISQYENYITLRKMCIDKHNMEISSGIFISIISWLIFGLLFHK